MRFGFAVVLALTLIGRAASLEPGEALTDPVLEDRARALSEELRCLVCQNESIDDSAAPLARDLRRIVRERLSAGDSDEQVLDYIVARYGEFVLLRPRVSPLTWLLWFGPFVAVALGAGAIVYVLRRRSGSTPDPLTDAEETRLRDIAEH